MTTWVAGNKVGNLTPCLTYLIIKKERQYSVFYKNVVANKMLSEGCLPEREAHPGGKLQHGAVHWGPGHCHDTQGSYFHLIFLQKFNPISS